jgi:periplasmic divalent cation tolerance protein
VGRRLARLALKARLAACANIVPRIESHYWWRGKIESSRELLVIFKTSPRHLARLESVILEHHPYDTPEFVLLPLTAGNSRYLDWISGSLS